MLSGRACGALSVRVEARRLAAVALGLVVVVGAHAQVEVRGARASNSPPLALSAAARAKAAPDEVEDIVRRVNAYRAAGARCGDTDMPPVPPVAWNDKLERMAQAHSQDQAQHERMSHAGSDGSTLQLRFERAGYRYQAGAENVSAGYNTVAEGLAGWMRSPGHCRNMMSAAQREIGVAGARGASGTWYRTMVLGARFDSEIAAERPAATSPPTASPAAPGAAPPPATTNAEPAIASAAVPADQVVAALNRVRAGGGTCGGRTLPASGPLQWDERISRVAAEMAADAARQALGQREGRERAEGGSLDKRLERIGYAWIAVGDLTDVGGRPLADALQAWLDDERLCAMIFFRGYRHVGLAGAQPAGRASAGTWVMVLAAPAP